MSYKHGFAVALGCVIAAAIAWVATYPRFFSPPQPAPTNTALPNAQTPLAAALPSLKIDHDPLSWAHLTGAQRAVLAPFASEWDTFSVERKRKWIKIAARFPKMSPQAQKRLQQRMAEWIRMTPEQRRIARENYQISKALPPQARQKAWTAYQQLSKEQKARLAASEHKPRPSVVSAPPSSVKSEVRGIDQLVNVQNTPASASKAPMTQSQVQMQAHAPASATPPASSANVPASSAPPNSPSPLRDN